MFYFPSGVSVRYTPTDYYRFKSQPRPWARFNEVILDLLLFTVQQATVVISQVASLYKLTPTHLYDLLLHVDGVGDGGPIWLHLRVLPGLTASCQGKDFLREIEF